jgi:hypothetical protein
MHQSGFSNRAFENLDFPADVQKSKYVIDFVTLNNSEATIKMMTIEPVEPSFLPDLNIMVSDINLNNNDVLYTLDDAVVTKGTFNSNALV